MIPEAHSAPGTAYRKPKSRTMETNEPTNTMPGDSGGAGSPSQDATCAAASVPGSGLPPFPAAGAPAYAVVPAAAGGIERC